MSTKRHKLQQRAASKWAANEPLSRHERRALRRLEGQKLGINWRIPGYQRQNPHKARMGRKRDL